MRAISRLIPLTLAVFVGFLTIGISLPVLPVHIHETLGLGTTVVGAVIGIQFAAALLSRAWAGNFADTRGGRPSMLLGLVVASLSGLVYLMSLAFLGSPDVSVGVLLAGRLLLGCGESLIVTGAFALGIGLVGPQNAGKAMAWMVLP
ncbi:MFS transporter [Luteibacter sp.]|uniref:MFS transporter n=1 Tax=Luteibacter sp. TaxID=1886636 RepID=UPI0025C49037|nr:MFS transporter [Luteibacter sp.]